MAASTQGQNLERAAELMNDLPALWTHPGTTDQQREQLVPTILNQRNVV